MELISPAKINLFLYICGKRPDGYHDLYTLMTCIGLHDKVTMRFGGDEIRVICNSPDVPDGSTNLAWKAAALFFEVLGQKEGVNITIDKSIPVGAGLGGGSSNAATVLLGLNRHFGGPFSKGDLKKMALSIGSDVPFFIFQKPAIATGVGEQLEFYEKLVPKTLLIIFPGKSVSTAAVYSRYNLALTKEKKDNKSLQFKSVSFDAERHLHNDLEDVTVSMVPEVFAARTALVRHGADGALMSGSGTSVFGVFSDEEKACSAKKSLTTEKSWQVYMTQIVV
ncbi:MAG: 4-(cytidine 5'-diphospho)-2-C-methyl-D-erythritol kinase [Desulfobacterales bacterium]|nr:4-(cytidine 5'-diphospho)-2-C-methyl-D-erythritol kinase [Desulfobacterales bacterium]